LRDAAASRSAGEATLFAERKEIAALRYFHITCHYFTLMTAAISGDLSVGCDQVTTPTMAIA
jgi:hypothetical protein